MINDYNRKDVSNLKKSVVLIYNYDKNGELISLGSGVAAFKNNIIVTNAHVIEKNYKLEIISENNEKYNISGLLYYNKRKDIAIIKLSNAKSLKALRISKKIKTGEPVTAIGSPLGLKNTLPSMRLNYLKSRTLRFDQEYLMARRILKYSTHTFL